MPKRGLPRRFPAQAPFRTARREGRGADSRGDAFVAAPQVVAAVEELAAARDGCSPAILERRPSLSFEPPIPLLKIAGRSKVHARGKADLNWHP